MSNDEIIIVRETPPNVERQVSEIIIERGAAVGPIGATGNTGAKGDTGATGAQGEQGPGRAISLDPHGTISTGSEEISFNFTDHSVTTAGDHTLTFADDSEAQPDTTIEYVVTATTTITTPSDAAFFSTQTLSALAPNTYMVEIKRLTADATKNYGIAVGVKK